MSIEFNCTFMKNKLGCRAVCWSDRVDRHLRPSSLLLGLEIWIGLREPQKRPLKLSTKGLKR